MDINLGSIGFHWRWNLSPKLILGITLCKEVPQFRIARLVHIIPISLWFMVGISIYYSYGLSTNVYITGWAPPCGNLTVATRTLLKPCGRHPVARHPVGSGGGSRIRIRIFVRRQWSPHAKNVWYTFICHIYMNGIDEWNYKIIVYKFIDSLSLVVPYLKFICHIYI